MVVLDAGTRHCARFAVIFLLLSGRIQKGEAPNVRISDLSARNRDKKQEV